MWISTFRLIPYRKLISHCTFCRFSSIASEATTISEEASISSCNSINVTRNLLELDTDGVVRILNDLKREPDEALSFFWKMSQNGLCHDINCYSSIVRILCGSGFEKKLASFFLELIRSKDKHPHFEISGLFETLAESLGSRGDDDRPSPLNRVLDVLVKSYAELGMFDDAIDALFQTGRRGLLPRVQSCNFIMNILIDCGKTDLALALYHQLRTGLGMIPDVYTYTIIVKAQCRRGNLQEAISVFEEMEDAGITDAYARTTLVDGLCINANASSGYEILQAWRREDLLIDAFGYNAVIRGFCNEMRLQDAENVLEDMRNHGVTRDVYSYSGIICGYCKVGNILKAFSHHKEMVSDGVKSNFFIASAMLQCLRKMGLTQEVVDYFQWFKDSGMFLDEVSYNIVIDACCKLGEMEEAEKLLYEMQGRRMVPDVIHYTCLINGYCRQKELGSALDIFKEMRETGPKPDIITYNIIVGELSRHGYAQEAVEVIRYSESQGLKPSRHTYSALIRGLCGGGNLKLARDVLDALEEKCVVTCSAMVNGYCEAYHTREACDLFMSVLSKHGILVSKTACLNLLDKLCEDGDVERSLGVFQKLLNLEVHLDEIVYSKLIAALCRTGNMEKAQAVFDILVGTGCMPDVITYTTMMNGYCKAKCLQKAFDMFDDMKDKGIKPDVITYTVLINSKEREKLNKSSNKRETDTRSNSYDTPALQSEVTIRDIKPDVVYYTVLIDGHCKADNLQEAVVLFDEMMDRGFTPDAITYTALVSGYCNRGNADIAVYIVDEMVSKGIAPDIRTISSLEKGYKILEARKMKFLPD
ncbi:hypothetical protein ACHQM5_018688 [Ranunculus cassubicifolius]